MKKKKSDEMHKNKTEVQEPANLSKRAKVALQEKMDEKLQIEEQRFRSFVEHSSDIIVLLNLEGIITYINPAVEKVLGFKVEERIGAKGFELIHPDDKKLIADSYNTLATDTNSPVIKAEIRLHHKDGSWRTLEAVGSNLVHDNVVEAIIVNYRDISERKRMEDKLRGEEQRFRALAEQSSDIIIFVNQEGIVTYENPAVERSLGLKAQERIGVSLFERIHPDDLKFAMDAFNKFTLDKQSKDRNASVRQIRLRHKDGSWRTFEAVGSKLVLDNFVEFVIVNLRDITERKQAEKALREGEEFYRTIFENTGTSMILIEEDMTISMSNEEFVRNTGYSPDEINGRMKWTEIVHPDDLGRMVEQHRLRRESEGRALPNYEFRYITKTGDLLDTFLTIKLVPGTKKSIASLIDITERKRMEDKLQKTLESFRKAVGATIQVMVSAVEMRDPYTAGHQIRVANLAIAIATEMGLPQDKIDGIHMAASIHDIGKLSIPAEILSKPTKMTDIEFSLIKEHSRSGYEMLKDVESPWPLAEIIYQHHERMDGSGYPRNLKGDEILVEARIMAVADVVEAMAFHRPYRPGLGIEEALEEIEKNKGILYDDAVVDACMRLFREKGYQL
jgi:PAS domain S-box-containing protein/putative nucleotidyltransferase with HDIG domain